MNQGLQAESFWYDFSQDLIRKQDMEKSIIKSADEPNLGLIRNFDDTGFIFSDHGIQAELPISDCYSVPSMTELKTFDQ
jgi:hypothetical protein